MVTKRPIGFWVIVCISVVLLAILIFGQMMAFINYDFTVSLGLQESKTMVGPMGVAFNKSFGVGDTIIYIPLLLCGLVGLFLRKVWGLFFMAGGFAITAYWPIVCIFFIFFAKGAPGFMFAKFLAYAIGLTLVSLYGLWGFWYVLTHQKSVTNR